MKNKKAWTVPLFFFCGLLMTITAWAGDGSNLGEQATHYEPPLLAGTVSNRDGVLADASLKTVAGHSAESDSQGDYLVALDAEGLYTVTARFVLNSLTEVVEVFQGQTVNLDFNLGEPCEVLTWPAADSVIDMITCINLNHSRSEQ